MALLEAVSEEKSESSASQVVNDFSIVVATVNGTGSQTANLALLQAMFKMGIPVHGKNVFPSNIQGMPTWYYIRVSKDGYVARRQTSEILIAFNEATLAEDIASLPEGGVCLYNADWREIPQRDDIIYYGVPVNLFVRDTDTKGKFRDYIANMVYLGAIACLLGIPLDKLDAALDRHFGGRRKLVEDNMGVATKSYDWTAENIEKCDRFSVAPMNETAGKIVITGNEAAALGAVFGGVTLAAWYPITPSTSLIDALQQYLDRFRRDPETGEATFAVIQAEDELAAIGMVLGGGFGGARAMTATSGPGMSLMSEFAGLGFYAEIPAVIWDIQRVGPSTGLPTRTSQGDIIFAYYLGHGDTKNVILLPATVAECFEFGYSAFDLADRLQTPVYVLSDLDLGMNNWMSEPFAYPEKPINRGKLLSAEDLSKNGFARYKDVDGDGIGYRTIPGTDHPLAAWLARGTGHNEFAKYSERPEDYVKNMDRLSRKFDSARSIVPSPIVDEVEEAEVGIIAFGTTLFAVQEGRDRLAAEGFATSFMRLRALPINDEVQEFIDRHERIYVIELNHDGQMRTILRSECPESAAKLYSLSYVDGTPMTAQWVVDRLKEVENG